MTTEVRKDQIKNEAVTLTDTQTLTNKTLTTPKLNEDVAITATATELNAQILASNDGWIDANESWAYASASTITVPSGAAAKYAKGDKIKLTQTTVKYFYVVGVADTVLTVNGGTDYTVANAAITLNYYSHATSPIGFPSKFTTGTNTTLRMDGAIAIVEHWGYLAYEAAGYTGEKQNIAYNVTFASRPTLITTNIGKASSVSTSITDIGVGTDCVPFVKNSSNTVLAAIRLSKGTQFETSITSGHTYYFNFVATGLLA